MDELESPMESQIEASTSEYSDEEIDHAVEVLVEAEKIKSDKALMALVRPLLAETHAHMGNVVKSISDIKKARQTLPDAAPVKEEAESATE